MPAARRGLSGLFLLLSSNDASAWALQRMTRKHLDEVPRSIRPSRHEAFEHRSRRQQVMSPNVPNSQQGQDAKGVRRRFIPESVLTGSQQLASFSLAGTQRAGGWRGATETLAHEVL